MIHLPLALLIDHRRIAEDGVADKQRAVIREMRAPRFQQRLWISDRRGFEHRVRTAIDERREHIAALRVHPRDNEVGNVPIRKGWMIGGLLGKRVECGDADDGPI